MPLVFGGVAYQITYFRQFNIVFINARAVRAYQVRSKFNGDFVTVKFSNEICPDRSASGRRQLTGY
jgi:hypothetical protein